MNNRQLARRKQHLLDALMRSIYDKAIGELDALEFSVASKNARIQKLPEYPYRFKGQFNGGSSLRGSNPLHKSLIPEAEEVDKVKQALASEHAYVTSFIRAVLNTSVHAGDWLAGLPEVLHSIIKKHETDLTTRTVSDAEYHKIQTKHKLAIEMLFNRLAINLIT